MYTLKGIFPDPKKDPKKNFIRENMKQLKCMQVKPKGMNPMKQNNALPSSLGMRSSPSSRSGKATLSVGKCSSVNSRKTNNMRIKKGDMAEFLKRKDLRAQGVDHSDEELPDSTESSGRLRDIGCQTLETNLASKLAESTQLTMLYPKENDVDTEGKAKASGDSVRQAGSAKYHADVNLMDGERPRNRLNAILEKKDKDPYLPQSYQKGVVPKYLRERKEMQVKEGGEAPDAAQPVCPPGHVTLPDVERRETLKMLRNSFAELVNELNKMPVKTDTLRMRNRKMELEKQLAKLEEGIKVFSRPKVFVKIGE